MEEREGEREIEREKMKNSERYAILCFNLVNLRSILWREFSMWKKLRLWVVSRKLWKGFRYSKITSLFGDNCTVCMFLRSLVRLIVPVVSNPNEVTNF